MGKAFSYLFFDIMYNIITYEGIDMQINIKKKQLISLCEDAILELERKISDPEGYMMNNKNINLKKVSYTKESYDDSKNNLESHDDDYSYNFKKK